MSNRIVFILAVALMAVFGCSSIYKKSIGSSGGDVGSVLNGFWISQGFKKDERCTALGGRSESSAERHCWLKMYPGVLTPYSGYISAKQVIRDGVYVVYISSNHRESEAKEISNALDSYAALRIPDIKVVTTTEQFIDTR